MIRHLVRQCPRCQQVIKIKTSDDLIIEIEGAEQYVRWAGRRGAKSHKLIYCKHPNNTGQFDRGPRCGKFMLVRSFKEIVL